MEILPAATTATARAAPPPPTTISSDFQTFLRMLTAQMQNQDPLNPLQASDFAVQLATFSGVEQQVRSNELLLGLSQQMAVLGLTQLSGWVGMEARSTAPVAYSGGGLDLWGSTPAGAGEADLVIRDAAGHEVLRRAVPPGEQVRWDGTGADSAPMPGGLYTFELDAFSGGQQLGTVALESFSRIAEVRILDGNPELLLRGGVRLPVAEVSALRAAE